LKIIWENYKLS